MELESLGLGREEQGRKVHEDKRLKEEDRWLLEDDLMKDLLRR